MSHVIKFHGTVNEWYGCLEFEGNKASINDVKNNIKLLFENHYCVKADKINYIRYNKFVIYYGNDIIIAEVIDIVEFISF